MLALTMCSAGPQTHWRIKGLWKVAAPVKERMPCFILEYCVYIIPPLPLPLQLFPVSCLLVKFMTSSSAVIIVTYTHAQTHTHSHTCPLSPFNVAFVWMCTWDYIAYLGDLSLEKMYHFSLGSHCLPLSLHQWVGFVKFPPPTLACQLVVLVSTC